MEESRRQCIEDDFQSVALLVSCPDKANMWGYQDPSPMLEQPIPEASSTGGDN